MSVSRRILQGSSFVIVAGVLARIGTFLGSLVVIRLLGLEQVGQLGLIESWLALAGMFSLAGLGMATTRYVAVVLGEESKRIGEYAGTALVLVLFFSTGVGILLLGGVHLVFGSATAETSGLIVTARQFVIEHSYLLFGLLVMMTTREIGVALLEGMQLFRLFVYVNLILGLLNFPVSFLLVQSYGLAGAFGARLVLVGTESVLILIFALNGMHRLHVRLSLHGFFANSRSLLGFALPTLVGQIIANPVRTFMTTLLAAQPGGALQVGLLTTSNRIVGLASFVPASMASVVMPILSTDWSHNERSKFGANVLTTLRIMWLSCLPFIVFFLAATPALLHKLYGPDYVSAATITFIMLTLVLLTAINEISDRTLAATNHQWLSTGNNLAWAVLFWLIGLILVPKYFGVGYAVALLVSFSIYVALQLGWLRRLFQISLQPVPSLITLSLGGIFVAWWIAALPPSFAQVALSASLMLVIVAVEWQLLLSQTEQNILSRQAKQVRLAVVNLYHRLRSSEAPPYDYQD